MLFAFAVGQKLGQHLSFASQLVGIDSAIFSPASRLDYKPVIWLGFFLRHPLQLDRLPD